MTNTTRPRTRRSALAMLAAALLAAACSSTPDDQAAPSPATTAPQTTAAPATTESAPTTEDAPPTTAAASDGETTDTTEATEPTAETEPDTTEAEADEPADEEDGTEEAITDTAAPEADADEEAETDEGETDEAETDEGSENAEDESDTEGDPEVPEPAEPTYENRSASSVFPPRAYFDHDTIRALFPECSPTEFPLPQWMVDHFAHWDWMFAGWDTETHTTYNDKRVASGWWTDERLAAWRPGQGITAESARRNAGYLANTDSLTLWETAGLNTSEMYFYPHISDSVAGAFPTLYERLATVGYVSTDGQIATADQKLALIRDTSLAGTNHEGIDLFRLLWNWAQFRTQQAPIDKEPTAWAMRTLLEARDAGCVAEHMAAVCDGTRDAESPILSRSHRLGKALRSIVCAN